MGPIFSKERQQHFCLSQNTRALVVKGLLDEKDIWIVLGSDTCTLFFKIFFENPLQLIQGILDVCALLMLNWSLTSGYFRRGCTTPGDLLVKQKIFKTLSLLQPACA